MLKTHTLQLASLLKTSLTLCLRTLWIQHPLPSLVQEMSFSIRLWSVGWTLKNDFLAHGGYSDGGNTLRGESETSKTNLTKSISPWAQQRPAAWNGTSDLHEAVPIIHRCLENTQQEQTSGKGAVTPLTLKAHPFLLLFAIWSPECFLDARGSWLHLQTCAIKGVRMRRSPRFAERRFDLMIWGH